MIHLLFSIIGFVLTYRQAWLFADVNALPELKLEEKFGWKGFSVFWWTNQPSIQGLSDDLRFYYLLYAARYTERFFSIWLEPPKSDFWQMLLHHATTSVLVLLSYLIGYCEIVL